VAEAIAHLPELINVGKPAEVSRWLERNCGQCKNTEEFNAAFSKALGLLDHFAEAGALELVYKWTKVMVEFYEPNKWPRQNKAVIDKALKHVGKFIDAGRLEQAETLNTLGCIKYNISEGTPISSEGIQLCKYKKKIDSMKRKIPSRNVLGVECLKRLNLSMARSLDWARRASKAYANKPGAVVPEPLPKTSEEHSLAAVA
jgi:hypothetical protein